MAHSVNGTHPNAHSTKLASAVDNESMFGDDLVGRAMAGVGESLHGSLFSDAVAGMRAYYDVGKAFVNQTLLGNE